MLTLYSQLVQFEMLCQLSYTQLFMPLLCQYISKYLAVLNICMCVLPQFHLQQCAYCYKLLTELLGNETRLQKYAINTCTNYHAQCSGFLREFPGSPLQLMCRVLCCQLHFILRQVYCILLVFLICHCRLNIADV